MKVLAISLLVAAPLAASLFFLPAADAGTGSKDPAPAKLLSFTRNASELSFDVISTGCTKVSDFELRSSVSDTDAAVSDLHEPISIELIRKTPDQCKRMPKAMALSIAVPAHWPISNAVIVTNPFIKLSKIKRK